MSKQTQKGHFYAYILGILMCLPFINYGQLILNQDETGTTQNHSDSENVNLKDGYKYESTIDNYLHVFIDPSASGAEGYDGDARFSNQTFDRAIDQALTVGITPGSYGVSPTGASTYSVPIALPPGTASMMPSLAVAYSSQAGNGLLGRGWNLAGLSAITRGNRNLYYDGEVHEIEFTNDDPFALNGNRLVLESGTYGGDEATYKPEMEDFTLITSYGTVGDGPEWFKVETKSGVTFEYGRTADARLSKTISSSSTTVFWMLSKIYDCYGNYVEYRYSETSRELRIEEILYTGNDDVTPVLEPYNKIKFYYEDREDQNETFVSGSTVRQNSILTRIQITGEYDKIFKTYKFIYGYDLSGSYSGGINSYLNEIVEYGSDGEQLNATRFQYGSGEQNQLQTYVQND
ncbi:MAG: SpvB/TcaC N-terminal domain-containing protein, partial [Bacteroidota bacterium]